MADAFEIHDHRHELKQLRDTGDTKLFENRGDVLCPACDRPFERLFVTRKRTTTFPENDGARFCILREDDGVFMFRH